MFAKILDNPDLPQADQKEVLKKIVRENLKKNLPQVRLQLTHNYEALKPALIANWKYSLRIGLSLVSWQQAKDILTHSEHDHISWRLLKDVTSQHGTQKTKHLLAQIPASYPQPWKGLTLLALCSQHIAAQVHTHEYSWFIPTFVRLSAGIIQKYLKTKNEPAQSANDRIESDVAMVQGTEQWLEQAYLSTFKAFKAPANPQEQHITMCALSQIIAALCESQREGNLEFERVNRILVAAKDYVLSSYSLEDIQRALVSLLRGVGYNGVIKKIEVPESYDQKSEPSIEGICWLIHRLVIQHEPLLSKKAQLSLLLLAHAQSLSSALEIKKQIADKTVSLLAQTELSQRFEIDYPLALLLFKVHHYQPEKEELFVSKLAKEQSPITKVNRIRRLLRIDLGALNVDKVRYAMGQLSSVEHEVKEIVQLAKAVQFDFTDEAVGNLVADTFAAIAKHHGEAAIKVLKAVVSREKVAKRNVELCDRIKL